MGDGMGESNIVYLIFFYLSVGMLLPWNFFINVNGYWMYKLRTINGTETGAANGTDSGNGTDYSYDNGTEYSTGNGTETDIWSPTEKNDLQLKFTANLAIASMAPNVILLILNGLLGHRFKIFPRLLVSLVGIVVLFTSTLVLVWVDTDSWQREFLVLTLLTVVLINVCNGVFQGGLFGLAGMFPSRYMNSILTGQGLGGVFAAVVNIILLAIGGNEVDAAFYCFLLSVVFLSGSLVVFIVLSRTEIFKYYTRLEDGTEETSLLLESVQNKVGVSVWGVMKSIWEEEVTVFLIFFVTLACFPAITVLVESTSPSSSPWTSLYFVPVSCFLCFNVGDYLGRTLSSFSRVPKPGSKLGLVLAFLRLVFIPLFMLCNVAPGSRYYTPVLIYSDTAYILLILLLAASNGYLTSVVMVSAPGRVAAHQQQTAANLMAGILGMGLAAGAALSAACVHLL